MGHGEAKEDEAEEGGDGGADRDDPEGGQKCEGLGGEAFAGGGDERRDGVPCGEPASETFSSSGIHNRGEQHPKLRDDGNAAADIAVKPSNGREREADGEAGKQKRSHSDGKKQQAGINWDTPENHDSGDQHQTNKKVEYHHVKTTKQDGLARKIDLREHGLRGIERIWRAHDRIHEDLPQKGPHHGKSGIRNTSARNLHDALGIQENESHRGHKRRQECPDVAKEGLAVLGAEVANEQAPSQLATGPDVSGDRAHELGRMTKKRLGRIDADGKFRVGHAFIEP